MGMATAIFTISWWNSEGKQFLRHLCVAAITAAAPGAAHRPLADAQTANQTIQGGQDSIFPKSQLFLP